MESELISVDPLSSTLVMNWYISYDNCYQDPDPETSCTPTNLEADTPIFTWYPGEINDTLSTNAIFRTTSLLFNNGTRKTTDSSLQNYPFDTYGAYFIMYGKDNSTTNDNLINVVVDYSYGIAVGFKTSSDTSFSEDTAFYVNGISLARNGLIKAYVVCIVIGVWLITLIFVGSVMKVMFGYKQPKEALGVPIATLFAFSSLRGTMPGAPSGFGAIMDFVGILPCLAIITIAGVVLFGYLVVSNSEVTAMEPSLSFLKKNGESQITIVDPEKAGAVNIHSFKNDGSETPSAKPDVGSPNSDASFVQNHTLQYEPLVVGNFPNTHGGQ
ncbi:hypothetical protein BDQ17DRAFT_1042938 [Cyathus striatus]|nr:hypothetical protein BDQ17DRAFT_1042938 [Cyathus striatus]